MDVNKIILLFCVLAFLGCSGGGDGGGSEAQCSKEINSEWESIDLGVSFSLSSFQIGVTGSTLLNYDSGEVCELTLRISGSECSGSLIITGGSYQGGGSEDPGCSSLTGIKDYTISGTKMKYCEANSTTECDDFE